MSNDFSLAKYDINVQRIIRNASPAQLYKMALRNEAGSCISSTGALIAYSGEKTGRSPKDKRIVDEPGSQENVWWGDVNIKLDEHIFMVNRERAIDYLNTREHLFVVDGYAGWDERYRFTEIKGAEGPLAEAPAVFGDPGVIFAPESEIAVPHGREDMLEARHIFQHRQSVHAAFSS